MSAQVFAAPVGCLDIGPYGAMLRDDLRRTAAAAEGVVTADAVSALVGVGVKGGVGLAFPPTDAHEAARLALGLPATVRDGVHECGPRALDKAASTMGSTLSSMGLVATTASSASNISGAAAMRWALALSVWSNDW
jgi:hypothetical protein